MKILIDNGHGLMTAGQRRPDGLFREAFYNREIARKVVADLLGRNLDAELLVPEDDDIPLVERVRRINAHCLALGKKNVIVVSIHVNAAGVNDTLSVYSNVLIHFSASSLVVNTNSCPLAAE